MSDFEKELGWDDEISNEAEFVTLPAGDYDFEVVKFERSRSKGSEKIPASNMAVLEIRITDGNKSATVFDRLVLHTKMEWKLSQFFRAIGQKKHGEPVRMNWNAVPSIIDYAINNCDELYRNRATAVEITTEAPITERMALPMIKQHRIFSTPHRARFPVLIMLLCGLRVGEMIALTWEQIDFKEGIISVCQSAYNVNSNKLAIQNHTKNGKKRNVPIPPQLIDVLKKYKCVSKRRFLTTKSRGNDMHSRGSWKRMWDSYLETLEFSFTAHQLRHTYASMLYAAGVDVKTASELLGHSDIEITMKIYTHLTEQGKKLSIDKYNIFLSEHFSEILIA